MKIDGKFEGEMIINDGELIVGKTGSIKTNVKVKNAATVHDNHIVTGIFQKTKLLQIFGPC
jgi:cytoskeletal protein CcmA (bactofilin family)